MRTRMTTNTNTRTSIIMPTGMGIRTSGGITTTITSMGTSTITHTAWWGGWWPQRAAGGCWGF